MGDSVPIDPEDGSNTDEVAIGPLGALAVHILETAGKSKPRDLIYVSASERRAGELAAILEALAPDREVFLFPAWDCVPYDRVSPSREVMGKRVSVLRRLTQRSGSGRIVVSTPAALHQRVPPRDAWANASFSLKLGERFDADRLQTFLDRYGYIIDSRIDEPGEVAIRSAVIDIYPPAEASPYRIEHEEGRVDAIRCYDAVTQRTLSEVDTLLLEPASEVIPGEGDEADGAPAAGLEHRLADYYPRLESLFDHAPDAALMIEPEVEARLADRLERIAEAYLARSGPRAERRDDSVARAPLAPERLYITGDEWQALVSGRRVHPLPSEGAAQPVPQFALEANPAARFTEFAKSQLADGHRVVLAAASERDARTLARHAGKRLEKDPDPVKDWKSALAAPEGSLCAMRLDIEAGFILADCKITVIAAADVLGTGADGGSRRSSIDAALLTSETGFQRGDAVIHFDHGMAVLRGLETITAGETTVVDAVALEYAGETKLSVPADAVDRIWRYGSDSDAVSLDRIGGDAWPKRRAKVEDDLRHAAARLCDLAKEREGLSAPKLVPPRRTYERFAARFPFPETPDQEAAIRATLDDLASGRLMDRLVCGDVGFGKTEVALRAAAAVALAGRQVALVAPTTVLARQHYETFRRRFAGFGIEVAHLSRLVAPTEARAVKQGLSTGEVQVAVGTHALAAKAIRFKNLGLLVIDEEQRFGTAHKEKLRGLSRQVHVLTMTATPIPRTLQSALIGIQDLSIIATPPARRQPIRTFLMPWDDVTLRQALLRERRRAGQSFVVCPRIEDIEPLRKRLAEVVPELECKVAHGRMDPHAIDSTMLEFADGQGDVLLATNIIESGLDLPRANTIVIWRADRFGLAQLHQLRGRVGRGRVRGAAYLVTDPAARMAKKTEERLRTFQALDRLGAGFAISARDLDMRGAGDLFGKEQAGHVKLIGMELYQHLFERALAAARGDPLEEEWSPELNFGVSGQIPDDYVPEPDVRMNLYVRLARLRDASSIEGFADEIEDRFGPLPPPVHHLLLLAALNRTCRQLGIATVDAGPRGTALSFRPGAAIAEGGGLDVSALGAEWRGERLLLAQALDDPLKQMRAAIGLVEQLADVQRGGRAAA